MNLQHKSDIRALFAIKTLVHSVGGAERMAVSLAGALAKRRLDVHLLTFDMPDVTPFFPVDSAVKRHFVSVSNAAHKTAVLEYPKLLYRLRREIVALKPDVVIAFMHSMFVPVQLALLGTGIKVVLSEHTVPAYYKTRKLEFFALRFFSLFTRSITIVSERIRALYPFEMRQKMAILPDTVVSDFVAGDGSSKTILSVGRLNKDKDHAILVEAFSMIASEFPDWDLKIYGDGPERAMLENLAYQHGFEDRITFPGVSLNMDTVYKAARIFVLPSRYESFGLATAEAMTHALPVVGFADCSGTNELVKDKVSGILVKTRDKVELSAAMRVLIKDRALCTKYGESGQMIARKYALDNVADSWESYISNIVSGKASP